MWEMLLASFHARDVVPHVHRGFLNSAESTSTSGCIVDGGISTTRATHFTASYHGHITGDEGVG